MPNELLLPSDRGAINLGTIMERKTLRFVTNLSELDLTQTSFDQFIAPEETMPPMHVPRYSIELSHHQDAQIYHIQIAGRLEGDPESDEVVRQTQIMFEEVMNRSMNYIHSLADKLFLQRYQRESQEEPMLRTMRIGYDGTLITPVFRYGQQPVHPEDAAIVPVGQMPPVYEGRKYIYSPTKLDERFLKQIFRTGETQLDLATYYARAAELYNTDHTWATSATHRKQMFNGLWLWHSPFSHAMREEYFHYMMSHPDLPDRTFTEQYRDQFMEEFNRLDPAQQDELLVEMTSFTRDINSRTYISGFHEKLSRLPFMKQHLYRKLAAMNKTMEQSTNPVEEAILRYVYGIHKPRPGEDSDGLTQEDEQMAKVSNFSGVLQQFREGRMEKHAPFYPNEEDDFTKIIFSALMDNTFYATRLFPETARGARHIPTIEVTVYSPLAGHIIFSSPRPHIWHMSLIVGNPLDDRAGEITQEERKVEHRNFVNGLTAK